MDLLPDLLDPIFVPPAVQQEFGATPSWMIVKRPADVGMVEALRLVVDLGESEAIALAYEMKLRIILDDRKGRDVALRLGIAVTGTVGLLLKAKQHGVVGAVCPLLDALAANRFRISDALRMEALRIAGE